MKKIIIFTLCFLFIVSCGRKPENQQSPYSIIYTHESITPLFPDRDSSAKLEITISAPVFNNASFELANSLVYEGLTAGVYTEQTAAKLKEEYLQIAETEDDDLSMFMQIDQYHFETISAEMFNDTILVILKNLEVYTGGAHGMNTNDYFVINTTQDKRLLIDDIVNFDKIPELENLVKKALRSQAEIADSVPLTDVYWTDGGYSLNNFFLKNDGLGFLWNPYEIAAYAVGAVVIVIPFDELNGIIKEGIIP